MLRPLRPACALLAFATFACHHGSKRKGEQPFEHDAGEEPGVEVSSEAAIDAAADDADAPSFDNASSDAGAVEGDAELEAGSDRTWRGGESFDSALLVPTNGPGLLIDERSADQVDYFAFQGEAGKFYELTTDRNSFSPDNVMSLFDSDRHALAQNDDGSLWPGDAIDARLLVHIAKSGTYFVAIEDPFTPPDFFGSGPFSLLYYHLTIREITPTTKGFVRAQAAGPTEVSFEHDEKSGYDYVTLLGELRSSEEVFAFQGQADKALIGQAAPGGPEGNGSTFSGGHVRIATADAGVLAEIDRASGQTNIHPPITLGNHTLSVAAAGAALGGHPYYSLDLVQLKENPGEQAEALNNALSGAEAITFSGSSARRGRILARLPPNDVDYFRFELGAGDVVRGSCEGESGGSGVRELRAELRNSQDEKLSSAQESALDNLALAEFAVDQAGTYYLRLSANAQALGPPVERWARCALIITR
jgi:hypothetical protein